MKKFKLLLAAFVATLFAFVGGNAFADGATYSLTIKGAHVGHTYEAYQILLVIFHQTKNSFKRKIGI